MLTPAPSPLVRIPVFLKLIVLGLYGVLVYRTDSLVYLSLMLFLSLAVLLLARAPFSARGVKAGAVFVVIFFLVNLIFSGGEYAVIYALRLIILYLSAYAVTASTHFADFLRFFTLLATPLKVFGVGPRRVGLAFAMAIRFIPELVVVHREVREAQVARGVERKFLALFLPLIFRLLEMAQEIAMAVVARGFEDVPEGPETFATDD